MTLARIEWDGLTLEYDGQWSCTQAPEVADLFNMFLEVDQPGPSHPDSIGAAIDLARERAPNLKVVSRKPIPTEEPAEEVIY